LLLAKMFNANKVAAVVTNNTFFIL